MGVWGYVGVGGGIVIIVAILWYLFWPKTRGNKPTDDNDYGQCIAQGHITEHVTLAQCKASGGDLFTPEDIDKASVKLPGAAALP